jgi:hypothetical protein
MLRLKNKESFFNESINNCLHKTKLKVLSKEEIKIKYKDNLNICHLIEFDSNILCFINSYEKFSKDSPKESSEDSLKEKIKINNFIKDVTSISIIEKKKCIGVYISKNPLSKNYLDLFNINIFNTFISINNPNKEYILDDLITLLYSKNIYIYEEDGSCIMLC